MGSDACLGIPCGGRVRCPLIGASVTLLTCCILSTIFETPPFRLIIYFSFSNVVSESYSVTGLAGASWPKLILFLPR